MIDSLSKDKEVKDIDLKLRIGLSRFESRTHTLTHTRSRTNQENKQLTSLTGLFVFLMGAWCECVRVCVFAILRISIYASGRKAI